MEFVGTVIERQRFRLVVSKEFLASCDVRENFEKGRNEVEDFKSKMARGCLQTTSHKTR
jgi:hypothetical protein